MIGNRAADSPYIIGALQRSKELRDGYTAASIAKF
jgi:hypothetical protein